MSDSESICSEASLGETIEIVEDCLSKLSDIEREKFLIFNVPSADEVERRAIWSKYGIQDQVCTEDLAELLHRLTSEERDRPWFTWLRWVLFGT
jgi:hypothetical protein